MIYDMLQTERHDELSASEALCGFMGWLTTRQESINLGAKHDAGGVCRLIEKWCSVNKVSDPRSGWENYLKTPERHDRVNNLSSMRTAPIEIVGRATYTSYVANTPETTELGLMNVTEAQLPIDHGMIFVFDEDRSRRFWMRNTIIPLDIAFIRSDGTIVKTYTMKVLDESIYPSIEPARFALAVRAGQFAAQHIQAGDRVNIPSYVRMLLRVQYMFLHV